MEFNNLPTLLDSVIDYDKTTFISTHGDGLSASTSPSIIDKGNILFKIPANRTSLATLTKGDINHCLSEDYADKIGTNEVSRYSSSSLLQEVTSQFINIEANAPFIECINTIYKYQQLAGDHFYGALLRGTDDPDIIVNPFHILTALSIMENDEYLHNINFNILIYTYKDRALIDDHYETRFSDKNSVDSNINALMQIYTSKLTTFTRVKESLPVSGASSDPIHECRVDIKYTELIHKDEDPSHIYHIVAHQLKTNGIIAPYYGTSLVRWDRSRINCYGIHLSPMHSCNISANTYTYLNDPSSNVEFDSVCTGDLSNCTYEGLRTLTHSNLSSAFGKDNLTPGFLGYVDAMIEKSVNMYKSAGIIKELVPLIVPQKYSKEQMEAKTIQEYVTVTEGDRTGPRKYPLTELRNQFNEIQEYLKEQKTASIEDSEHCAISEDGCDINLT